MEKVKEEFALLTRMNFQVTGTHDHTNLRRETFQRALQLADKGYTLEIAGAIFDGMVSYYMTPYTSSILEEHSVEWVIDNTEDGEDTAFFPPEEMKALKAALATEQAAIDAHTWQVSRPLSN